MSLSMVFRACQKSQADLQLALTHTVAFFRRVLKNSQLQLLEALHERGSVTLRFSHDITLQLPIEVLDGSPETLEGWWQAFEAQKAAARDQMDEEFARWQIGLARSLIERRVSELERSRAELAALEASYRARWGELR